MQLGSKWFRMRWAVLLWLVSLPVIAECPVEARVLWTNGSMDWVGRFETDRVIDRTLEAGFNVLMPSVWHGRGVTWDSDLAPRDWNWKRKQERDPFRYLLDKAHAAGLEVHPSISVAARYRNFFPEYHIAEGIPPNTVAKAFDLHDAGFRTFIVTLVEDLVSRYPVDGVNLDFIRTRGVCTTPECARDYAEHSGGRNVAEDARRYYRDKRNTDADGAAALAAWNGEAVDDIVRRVREVVQRHRPNTIITTASHAGNADLRVQGADSVRWLNEGWIDYLLHMDYRSPTEIKVADFEWGKRAVPDPSRLIFLVGNFRKSSVVKGRNMPIEAEKVVAKIDFVRTLIAPRSGVALWQDIYMTPEQIALLKSTVFSEQAGTPWRADGENCGPSDRGVSKG